MADVDAKLAALVSAALAESERAGDVPDFQHVWTRARAIAGTARGQSRRASNAWTAATAAAVLLAVGIGVHGLRQVRDGDAATRALMAELSASTSWQAPSDRMPGLANRSLLSELPDIPMVDTSPEEWVL